MKPYRNEFNEEKYPNVFFDYTPRPMVGKHHVADANFIVPKIGYYNLKTRNKRPISPRELRNFAAQTRLTIYWPSISTAYYHLKFFEPKFKHGYINPMLRHQEELRNLLKSSSVPKTRIVDFDIERLSYRNWRLNLARVDKKLATEVEDAMKNGFRDKHAVTVLLTKLEDGTLLTFDTLLAELAQYHNVNVVNLNEGKLPDPFDLDWTMVAADDIRRQQYDGYIATI